MLQKTKWRYANKRCFCKTATVKSYRHLEQQADKMWNLPTKKVDKGLLSQWGASKNQVMYIAIMIRKIKCLAFPSRKKVTCTK